ncbi:MAG: phage tail tape measure protein [Lachnospiraceae bacterium]|nr:phage tail tape measure protein [Lachnospiraceae bacterium]
MNDLITLIKALSSSSLLGKAEKSLLSLSTATTDMETAMENLYRVTSETKTTYEDFFKSASQSAQRLSVSLSGLINQTTEWVKLGYALADAAKLAEVSALYSNISGIGDIEAIAALHSTMKAFNLETENAISLVDRLCALSKEYSLSPSSFATSFSQAATTLADAGHSLDESLAIYTALASQLQDTSLAGSILAGSPTEAIKKLDISEVEQALQTISFSEGFATEAQIAQADSLTDSITRFQSAFASLSSTIADSGLLQFFVDLGTIGVKAFNGLSDLISPLGAIATLSTAMLSTKNVGSPKMSGLLFLF